MNDFEKEILKSLGKENFLKVRNVKIGIAGAGGLGSNCAFNLVRAGFRKFRIIDFDRVEHSNLNRQFYFLDQVGKNKVSALAENLKRINPDIGLEALVKRVEKDNAAELFGDCDIVVEAFDRAQYKSMLVSSLAASGKLIVSASGLAGAGKSDEIKVHRKGKNLIVIGDLVSDVNEAPPLSPRVNIAAAKQADTILEYILTR
ncbi:MAG: sulfur carrier protein ThiS adenylyltransferase ThiF [Candidatus Omnitrophota bacterium]